MNRKPARSIRLTGESIDRRATRTILGLGWVISRERPGHPCFVAKKVTVESDDGSTTTMYESDITLEGLGKLIERREREEGFIRAEVAA